MLALSILPLAAAMRSVELTDPIRTALDRGRADEALEQLDKVLAQNASDAEAHNLRCRVFYQERRWDDAIPECRLAVSLEPSNSTYHLWLGRAIGEKADRVSFVQAFKMARQVRSEFETAVKLAPQDVEALSDLAQFDIEAPAIVGGGTDKAEKIAQQLLTLAPDHGHEIKARIAEGKKDYETAENEFKAAIAASASPSRAWMDLASFYRRRHRWDDMIAAARSGAALDKDHGVALVDGASILMHADKEPELATQWMRQYLASSSQAEEAPAFAVHVQLGQLLKQMGDESGASQEYAAARALATGYRDAKQNATNTGR
jgi:tetratricopeptide (TPR) repeat protein